MRTTAFLWAHFNCSYCDVPERMLMISDYLMQKVIVVSKARFTLASTINHTFLKRQCLRVSQKKSQILFHSPIVGQLHAAGQVVVSQFDGFFIRIVSKQIQQLLLQSSGTDSPTEQGETLAAPQVVVGHKLLQAIPIKRAYNNLCNHAGSRS